MANRNDGNHRSGQGEQQVQGGQPEQVRERTQERTQERPQDRPQERSQDRQQYQHRGQGHYQRPNQGGNPGQGQNGNQFQNRNHDPSAKTQGERPEGGRQREGNPNRGYYRDNQRQHPASQSSGPRFITRSKGEETIDDIKEDIARIEKEIELEIKEIKSLKL